MFDQKQNKSRMLDFQNFSKFFNKTQSDLNFEIKIVENQGRYTTFQLNTQNFTSRILSIFE